MRCQVFDIAVTLSLRNWGMPHKTCRAEANPGTEPAYRETNSSQRDLRLIVNAGYNSWRTRKIPTG